MDKCAIQHLKINTDYWRRCTETYISVAIIASLR